MSVEIQQSHGDRYTRMSTAPEMGEAFGMNGMSIRRIPSQPFEVNFRCDQDAITFTTGSIEGDYAYQSDMVTPLLVRGFSAAFHPAGTSTYVRGKAVDGEFFALSIDRSFRDQFAEDTKLNQLLAIEESRHNIALSSASSVLTLFRRFFATGHRGGQMATQSLGLFFLSEVLTKLASIDSDRTPGALNDRHLERVLEAIDASLSEDVGLTELAAIAELSPYHFARSFKQKTGLSPHQYVIERRLDRAREMLEQPGRSLADVAYDVGFSSQAHMTDVFKKRMGVTPGAYRKDVLE